MAGLPETLPATPFYLAAEPGQRFCLYYAPAPGMPYRGAWLYLHPFAEEMNRSRRIAALQARTFAAMGFAVLQIDLFGCGDSSGDFGDARWEIWKHDVHLALQWLEEYAGGQVSLWGLRMGATLALDVARTSSDRIAALLLWQPVLQGSLFLTQFLRMRLAADMLGPDSKSADTATLRARLADGKPIEVAGYELAPDMAAAIDSIDVASWQAPVAPVHWFELVPESNPVITPQANRLGHAWRQAGRTLSQVAIPGRPFWGIEGHGDSTVLLPATSSAFAMGNV